MDARRRRLSGLAALVFAVVILAGCAQTTDLSKDAATSLQSSVRLVAEQAASRDYAAALASLDSLQSQLDGDIAAGLVSRDRGARIQAAIDLVRADLGPKATPSPTPTPSPTSTKGKGNGKDNGHGKDG
jgi:ribosomal protein S20